jgi:precorrin-3B methylase
MHRASDAAEQLAAAIPSAKAEAEEAAAVAEASSGDAGLRALLDLMLEKKEKRAKRITPAEVPALPRGPFMLL